MGEKAKGVAKMAVGNMHCCSFACTCAHLYPLNTVRLVECSLSSLQSHSSCSGGQKWLPGLALL